MQYREKYILQKILIFDYIFYVPNQNSEKKKIKNFADHSNTEASGQRLLRRSVFTIFTRRVDLLSLNSLEGLVHNLSGGLGILTFRH